MSFERGAHAEGDHRHVVPAADVHHVAHLFRGFRKHHGVGQRVGKIRLVLAVVLAHGGGGGHPVAQERLQLVEHGPVEFARLVHRVILV
ncbi:hypothetical protein D3C83_76580 [compost metagenome]